MRGLGYSQLRGRRARVLEYALVILTIAVIVGVTVWFLGHEMSGGLGQSAG